MQAFFRSSPHSYYLSTIVISALPSEVSKHIRSIVRLNCEQWVDSYICVHAMISDNASKPGERVIRFTTLPNERSNGVLKSFD